MWPSERKPNFGIFVKNFVDEMLKYGVDIKVVKSEITPANPFETFLKYAKLLYEFNKSNFSPDIVQVEYAFPTGMIPLISRSKKAKKILVFHGTDLKIWKKLPLGRFFYNLLIKSYDAFIFPSQSSFTDFSRNFSLPAQKIAGVIPRGIDSDFRELNREKSRAELSIKTDEIVILSVANFVQVKNHDAIVRALKPFSPGHKLKIVFIGDGPEKSRIMKEAEEVKNPLIEFLFPGSIDRELVKKWFSAADIFVHASVSESYGIVVREAMVSGLAVVASRIPAIEEAIEDGRTGLLFDPNSPEELRRHLEVLIRDESLRKTLGEQAKQSDKIWTMKKTAEKYLELYNRLLSK